MPQSAAARESVGIYLSVPFCRSKCTYCNFASGVYPATEVGRYVQRLIADLCGSRSLAVTQGVMLPAEAGSIYFGGGTPTLLGGADFKAIFAALCESFRIEPAAEITVECTPGQLSEETLAVMVECGVNRVSLGVQSFVDAEAAASGRLHTRATAMAEIGRLRAAGITNLNVDLIAGMPHQTRESWRVSLDCLLQAGVPHASVYMLEVDADSRLGRELLVGGTRYSAGLVPNEATIAEMYVEAVERLHTAGYSPYEISNFAFDGAESAHNLRYWLRQPYLGVGLDASSMLCCADGNTLRMTTTSDLRRYSEAVDFASVLEETTKTGKVQQLEEALFLGLRLERGIALADLREEFGRDAILAYEPIFAGQIADGLLEEFRGRLRLTMRGRLMSNEVFAAYLLEPVTGKNGKGRG
jgi:oxygen-independent coproporphyrinogen-3 oxidase